MLPRPLCRIREKRQKKVKTARQNFTFTFFRVYVFEFRKVNCLENENKLREFTWNLQNKTTKRTFWCVNRKHKPKRLQSKTKVYA